MTAEGGDPREEPVIRDKRRIDPVTGEVRAPKAPQGGGSGKGAGATPGTPGAEDPLERLEAEYAAPADELAQARAEAAERLNDLRRLQAEYVNYRRRVERDREVSAEVALARALTELLPVLDDLGRARDHGDLTGGFKSVADALEAAVARLGLVRFGEVGEVFDPMRHEALMHEYSSEVRGPTCVRVLTPGYQIGERIVRPARVSVAEPDPDAAPPAGPTGGTEGTTAPAAAAGAAAPEADATGTSARSSDDGATKD